MYSPNMLLDKLSYTFFQVDVGADKQRLFT